MSGNDLVRLWKDPDERGDTAHPAGEITLNALSGGLSDPESGMLDSFWWPTGCHQTFCGVYCPDPPIGF
jgi:hypothetical protein